MHKVANILDALPKSIQPLAKRMLTEVREAEDRSRAKEAAKAFDVEFRPKWPKAADKLSDDLEVLLRFYDYPAEHWLHLKTSNPIVISSHPEGVHHVADEPLRSTTLRRGPGYLQRSSTQTPGRFGVRSTGGVARLIA